MQKKNQSTCIRHDQPVQGTPRTSLSGALTALNSVKEMNAGFTPTKPKLSNKPGRLRIAVNSKNCVSKLNWMMTRFFSVCPSFQCPAETFH